MIDRTTRLRWRRRIRRSRRQVEDIGFQAEENLEKHFFKRLAKAPHILRFTLTWIALLVLLIGGVFIQFRGLDNYYLVRKPTPGGVFTEGILGTFTNANPIYATGSVDSSVSKLVFSGLLKYNNNNALVSDLAESWKVDISGKNYTVKLKPNLYWQDGKQLTSDDVVFTYQTIQNPDAQSPLFTAWKDISIKKVDSRTITFGLPNPLSSFADLLTNGIIPKHSLDGVTADQMRSVNFNTSEPVGSGPFRWDAVEVNGQTPVTREEQIALTPNPYYVGGKPKLNKFIVRAFHDEKNMLASFRKQELNAVVGLTSVPDDLNKDLAVHEYDIPLDSETLVFFKTTSSVLSSQKVRQALLQATDNKTIISGLGYPVKIADEPLIKSSVGYNPKYRQYKFDQTAAIKLLDSDGWKIGQDGIRFKKDQKLTINLFTQNTKDYKYVSDQLKKQWQAVGVDLNVNLETEQQLQPVLTNHSYDVLLYGVELGADSDVFPYWHSSQADIRAHDRTNFSEYKSSVADTSLEAERTRLLPALRTIKYQPFLQAWQKDVPAIALYQPRFLYLTRGQIFYFDPKALPSGVERYENVNNWEILQSKQPI